MLPVTYAINGKGVKEDSGVRTFFCTLTVGDGVTTYGAAGIALSGGSMGVPNEVKSLLVMNAVEAAHGYGVIYDKANGVLRLMVPSTGLEVGAGVAPSAFPVYVEVKGW